MKVITVTTYNVYNYGAVLQAYALQQYLKEHGFETELLNYQPEYLTRKYNYRWINPESGMDKLFITRCLYRVMKWTQRQLTIKRKHAFDNFIHDKLLQTRLYTSKEEIYLAPPSANLYIVGSDQIWNTFYETGRDSVFYLDFVKKAAKASYAASFSYLNIEENIKPLIKKWLSDFKGISVREYHGMQILEELSLPGEWVLDPVFLLDNDKWKNLMKPFHKKEPFLLIYDFEGNQDLKVFAKKYAKKKNLKIYSINDTYPLFYADMNFSNEGPDGFLSLIYNCDAFVSNSFHGTAFSIIFSKPVYVFNRNRHMVNSRMESLMTLFDIKDCIIQNECDYDKVIEKEWDFNRISDIRRRALTKSLSYLNTVLNSI